MTDRRLAPPLLVVALALACVCPGLPFPPTATLGPGGESSSTPAPEVTATTAPAPSATPLHGDWPLYTSEGCAFSIRYPPGGTLTEPEDSVRIDLPFTPGTNLQEKYLDVTCRNAPPVCETVYAAGFDPGAVNPHPETINGVEFLVQNAAEGAAGNFYEWIAYSAANGASCASLTFILHSTNASNYDPPLTEFDRAAESAVFAEIMGTFGWGGP